MGYTITVSDSSYKGLFKYVDADNVTNGEYVSELTIPEHIFSTTSETQTIKVYVRAVSGLAETIDFVVNVDAYQITS